MRGGGGARDAVCVEPTLLRGLCNYGSHRAPTVAAVWVLLTSRPPVQGGTHRIDPMSPCHAAVAVPGASGLYADAPALRACVPCAGIATVVGWSAGGGGGGAEKQPMPVANGPASQLAAVWQSASEEQGRRGQSPPKAATTVAPFSPLSHRPSSHRLAWSHTSRSPGAPPYTPNPPKPS